jgi:acyl-CoA reductase-like NAD-dependent aldehyde dehydrogenase
MGIEMDADLMKNFVNGEFVDEGKKVTIMSPVDGKPISEVILADKRSTLEAIDSAHEAYYRSWAQTTIRERQSLLSKLALLVQEKSNEYATMESVNTGKTLRQSMLMDIPLGISHIEYFAGTDEFKFSREITHPEYPDTRGIVQNAPMGVVGAIAPWNVPFLMAVWKIAPAVLAGNTIVLKPSHHTPLTALNLAKDIREAGFPPGVINIVAGTGSEVGNTICTDDRVSMVSFTGSTATGKKVMSMASESLKKVTLELGGKSPNIVMPDADLDHAAKGILFGIFLNSGQLCESGSRLIVHSSVREKLISRMTEHLRKMKAGNPMDMETEISAITTGDQLEKIGNLVREGESQGARILYQRELGDSVPEGGFYFPPTILDNVTDAMTVAREEIFGPVLAVSEFTNADEAVRLANSSKYGLASGLWTRDMKAAIDIGSRIEAGTVWINEYHMLSAAAPRGGFKKSGTGRELGLEGILEYTQTRHLFINEKESDFDRVAYGLIISDQDQ